MKLGAEVYLNSNVAAFIAVEGAQLCSFTFWQRAHRHLVDKKRKNLIFFLSVCIWTQAFFLVGLWGPAGSLGFNALPLARADMGQNASAFVFLWGPTWAENHAQTL